MTAKREADLFLERMYEMLSHNGFIDGLSLKVFKETLQADTIIQIELLKEGWWRTCR